MAFLVVDRFQPVHVDRYDARDSLHILADRGVISLTVEEPRQRILACQLKDQENIIDEQSDNDSCTEDL